jgi:alpha-1,3-rhamnosyltransferase
LKSGIASNCNRGLREANGDWIKFIGGDDIILSNGINLLVEFQSRHNYASLIHGRVIYINKGGDEIQTVSSANKLLYPTFNEEFRSNKIHAPSVFFLRSALNDVGGFNEQYKIEDIYVYLKLLSKGMLAYYTNGIIAKYRIHQNNISSDNLFMLDEHLRILSEYKKRPGFVLNYYFFCRNVLLLNLLKKNISNKNIRLIIQKNPLVFISIFDAVFWYRYMKGLGKKFLKVKYHG